MLTHPGPIVMFPASRGRKPGAMAWFTCCACGIKERASGGSNTFKCTDCRAKSKHTPRRHGTGKDEAMGEVMLAIQAGDLPPATQCACADCGCNAVEYEHRDYGRPLDVVPICRSCNLRRGPALPLAGSIAFTVKRGGVPYRLRANAIRVLRLMGRDTSAVEALPAKLTHAHWVAIAPLFA